MARIEIHSEPDEQGRYTYTMHRDTNSPPYCSECGGRVEIGESGPKRITCVGYPSGSTPERRKGCGTTGATMHRAQVFFATLPDQG